MSCQSSCDDDASTFLLRLSPYCQDETRKHWQAGVNLVEISPTGERKVLACQLMGLMPLLSQLTRAVCPMVPMMRITKHKKTDHRMNPSKHICPEYILHLNQVQQIFNNQSRKDKLPFFMKGYQTHRIVGLVMLIILLFYSSTASDSYRNRFFFW